MPVVPFTPGPKTKSGRALPPPPAEPFALMAAAQIHAEGRLVVPEAPKGGKYIGELGAEDDLSHDDAIGYGRRNGDKIEQHTDPKDIMKNRPADEEGYTLPDNPTLFIRKKREEALTS